MYLFMASIPQGKTASLSDLVLSCEKMRKGRKRSNVINSS